MKIMHGNSQYCFLDDGFVIYEVSRGSETEKIVAIRYSNQWWKMR
ncbi:MULTISPECIES: hypothetical protein [Clostridium]|nr:MULTISPECIES: hypothetical protein [Clostridium]